MLVYVINTYINTKIYFVTNNENENNENQPKPRNTNFNAHHINPFPAGNGIREPSIA